jgi:N-acetylmuramoyl-L-alanine amidase
MLPGRPVFVFLLMVAVFVLVLPGTKVAWGQQFSDIKGHWAATEILRGAAEGYLKGYPDGSFRPDEPVTRAEFVTLVNKAFGLEQKDKQTVPFKDVRLGDWFYEQVGAALDAGYVSGYPDGTFRPDEKISRQEAATLLAKLLNLQEDGSLPFADRDQIAAWARSGVAALTAREILKGYPDGCFHPLRLVTRAEAAVSVNKARGYRRVTPVSLQLTVVSEVVNIRSGPGLSYPVIGQVRRGDVLAASARSADNWYQVKFGAGNGWIAGWLVRIQQQSPDRQDPHSLLVAVERQDDRIVVSLKGGEEFSWKVEGERHLLVTVPGVTVVRSPLQLKVEDGGVNEVITKVSGNQAVVEITFAETPLPVFYEVKEGEQELEIIIPYQINWLEAEEEGDALLITVGGTKTLEFQSFSLKDPKRLVFDFSGFTLHQKLQGWKVQPKIPGFGEVRVGQFAPGVVRLVVEADRNLTFARLESGKKRLVLKVWPSRIEDWLIVLDPGHGGSDPGAIGKSGLREEDVNLAVALKAAEILQEQGVKVVLTRTSDTYVELRARAEMANSYGAAVFVSIHCNASLKLDVGGTATYTFARDSLAYQQEERLRLARLLQEELVAALGLRDLGVFQENFAVLRYTQMPAALVEIAFISNPSEEQLLADPGFRERAAAAIARGIVRFLTE